MEENKFIKLYFKNKEAKMRMPYKINCPYCNKQITQKSFNHHLCSKHFDKYNEQIQLIKQLFYDYNFSKYTLNQYKDVLLSIKTIYNIWQQTYSEIERRQRRKNVFHYVI